MNNRAFACHFVRLSDTFQQALKGADTDCFSDTLQCNKNCTAVKFKMHCSVMKFALPRISR